MQRGRLLMKRRYSGAFTLIEVMVAVVVLAVGLLGMASLMVTSMQSTQSAYYRSQASLLVSDLLERMRGNRDSNGDSRAVGTDDYVTTLTSTSTCPAAPSCTSCSPEEQAGVDMHTWCTDLKAGIPSGGAVVTRSGSNQYRIEINWQETYTSSGATQNLSYVLERVDL